MKKLYILFFLLFVFSLCSFAQQSLKLDWAKRLGGVGNEYSTCLVEYSSHGIIVAGTYTGTADFDPGPATYNMTSNGNTDVFIVKLDSAGGFIWAKSVGGNNEDKVSSIDVDSVGNIYMTGVFKDTADFDPGAAELNLISIGGFDIYFVKLNSSGDLVWAESIGNDGVDNYGNDGVSSIKVGDSGNIYIAGNSVGADFDPGSGIHYAGSSDYHYDQVFCLKLTSNGAFCRVSYIHYWWSDYSRDLDFDNNENVYITGETSYCLPIGGYQNQSKSTLSWPACSSAFIVKINKNGSVLWGKELKTYSDFSGGGASGQRIIAAHSGGILLAGYFDADTIDFDPGPGNCYGFPNGYKDFFVEKLDTAGNFIWVRKFGGTGNDQVSDMKQDSEGNIFLTGTFNGTVDFDPGPAVFNLTSTGVSDMFLLKLDSSGIFLWAEKIGGSGNELSAAMAINVTGDLYLNGSFYGTVDFDPGGNVCNLTAAGGSDACVLKFHPCTPTAIPTLINATECDTFFLNGQAYTQSGTYSQILENATGCDSTIILNLKSGNLIDIYETGCDSFTFNSQTYTTSGNYTQTFTNQAGCDSVINLHLTINTINTGVTQINYTLVSNESLILTTFQWVDCNNNYAPVPGATGQTFTPASGGYFAVIVTRYGCSDTSACYLLTTGINETVENDFISLQPNPANDFITLSIPPQQSDVEVLIFNSLGEQVIKSKVHKVESEVKIDVAKLPAGIYFVKMNNYSGKFIKQ